MAKIESTFKNMLLSLLLVSAGAGAALSGVYVLTKSTIEQAKRTKTEDAIHKVLTSFDRYEVTGVPVDEAPKSPLVYKSGLPADTLYLYRAYKGDKYVGTAVKTNSMKGFAGKIEIMVGIDPEGVIVNTAVLDHHETPGLGDKMSIKKSKFPEQFMGKNTTSFKLSVKKDGGDVQAITAATISSRAFCDAVTRAVDLVNKQNDIK